MPFAFSFNYYQQSIFNDCWIIWLQETLTGIANHSAINSSDIFLMRAGTPSVQAICLLPSGFCSSLTAHLGRGEAVEEVEQEGKMEITSLEITGNYCENMFKINNKISYPPINPRTVLDGAGKRYKKKFKNIFFPGEFSFVWRKGFSWRYYRAVYKMLWGRKA